MPNDIVPTTPQAAVESFTDKLNLPALIAGPAGKAISRLIAGVIEIPAAYLDSFAQSIKDKTESRTLVNKEVANAAAKLATGDSDIVARAAHNLLAKEYRHQKNKEDIARKTIEILHNEPEAPVDTPGAPPPPNVEEDWLNVFERFAEDANSERLQTIWAHVLAGQIRRPKAFSLQTLRFIAELDEITANLFEKYADQVILDFMPFPKTEGPAFNELLLLSDSGLVSSPGTQLSKTFEFGPTPAMLSTGAGRLLFTFDKEVKVKFPVIVLTRIGAEVMKIVKPKSNLSKIKELVEKIEKDGMVAIHYLAPDSPRIEILWSRPVPPPATTTP